MLKNAIKDGRKTSNFVLTYSEAWLPTRPSAFPYLKAARIKYLTIAVSSVEEFLIIRNSDTSKDLYLAMVCEIHELFFTIECWGCTHKHNCQKGIFKIIHVLKDGSPTTMIPHKDVISNPWTWDINFDTMSDCVLICDVEVLSTGKLDAKT